MARKRRSQQPQGANQYEQESQPRQHAGRITQSRTVREINHAVLSRYIPGLERIVGVAPFTVLYMFSSESRQWEKCGIEGSLFVCQTWRDDFQGFSVVILNRKSLDNFIVDVTGPDQVELTEQYIILQGIEGDGSPQIYGVWIFSEEGQVPNTKDRIGDLIQRCAIAVGEQSEFVEYEDDTEDNEAQQYDQPYQQQSFDPVMTSQPLDLNTLFNKPQLQPETHIPQAQPDPFAIPSQAGQQLDLLKLFGGPQPQPHRYPQQGGYQQAAQAPQFGMPSDTQFFHNPAPFPQPQQPHGIPPHVSTQHNLLSLFKSGSTG